MPATERAGVRQSDLAKELGLTPAEIKAERDKLGPDDWWQVVRAIYWSEEAAGRLRGGKPPEATPETLTLRCVRAAINKRYVYCDLKGVKVPVRCKKGIGHKLVKKPIKVSVDRSGETPIYTHVR